MANAPLINARATVTARNLANGNIASTFLSVKGVNFDFTDGAVNVVDATGSFYFPLKPMTSITVTIVAGPNGQYSFVMS